MDERLSGEIMALAQRGLKLLATCDDAGVPHLAAFGTMTLSAAGEVAVTDWFCPGTIMNARRGHAVSLVVWDPGADVGHQLVGRVLEVQELAVLDGYSPEDEDKPPIPQMERRLLIKVDKVLAFHQAAHSDLEE